jgi:hypothetical protein
LEVWDDNFNLPQVGSGTWSQTVWASRRRRPERNLLLKETYCILL